MVIGTALSFTAVGPVFALAQNPPVPDAGQAATRDLQQQAAILRDKAATPQQREEAARRLVSRSSAEARDLLLGLLARGDRDMQLAVARALAADIAPDPRFIDPLVDLLGQDRNLTEFAALALVAYKDNQHSRDRLLSYVATTTLPVPARAAAIGSLGRLVDRLTASTLIDLLRNDNNPVVRDSAADALVEMTGLVENGRDLQRWNRWWDLNGGKSPSDWAAELIHRKAARSTEMEQRLIALRERTDKLMRAAYQSATDDQRSAILKDYLQNNSEDVRLLAARLVHDEVTGAVAARPIAPVVLEILRGMVGDSSTEVRKEVIKTLAEKNDIAALDALLTQLAQEKDADVRAEIVRALGRSADLKAVEPLLASLDDEYFAVARNAADALKELGQSLKTPANATAQALVAARLQKRLAEVSFDRAAAALRISIVEAMARLEYKPLRGTLEKLLKPDEQPRIIIAALRGVGALAEPASADVIMDAGLIDHETRGVRLEAFNALRLTAANFGYVARFRPHLSESEPDPDVRSAAWEVISALLEKASLRELDIWAGILKDDATRRLRVFEVSERTLVREQNLEKLAACRQNLGETLMKLSRFDEAADKFKQALDYWDRQNAAQFVTDLPIQQRMEASLRAKKYADAVDFAIARIKADRQNEPNLWRKTKEEIERLQRAKEYNNALALIKEAKRIGLAEVYSSLLSSMEDEIKKEANMGVELRLSEYGDSEMERLSVRLA